VAEENTMSQVYERLALPREWSATLDACQGIRRSGLAWEYTGKHDVKPLARMLASGEPVPAYVVRVIATLLDPPKTRWCGRLRFEPPPKRAIEFWKNKGRERRAKIDLGELRNQGMPFKKAIHQVAKKYRRSESWVANLRPVDDKRDIAEALLRLDPTTLKP
jgi:hypothetical protein